MKVDFPTPVSPNINTFISVLDGGDLCNGSEDVDGVCSCETDDKGRSNIRDEHLIIFTRE
jgi:hypothetical protein